MKKSIINLKFFLSALLLSFIITLHSIAIEFFSITKKTDKSESKKIPTVITSESLEIDIENNKATFLDNVKVDDKEMTIECQKMTIFFETEKKKENNNKETLNPEDTARSISRIICEKNVVITRKHPGAAANTPPLQQAKSQHADYDVKTGMIVLTGDPIIIRGEDSLKGEIITIWRDSEKMSVKRGVELKMKSEDEQKNN